MKHTYETNIFVQYWMLIWIANRYSDGGLSDVIKNGTSPALKARNKTRFKFKLKLRTKMKVFFGILVEKWKYFLMF